MHAGLRGYGSKSDKDKGCVLYSDIVCTQPPVHVPNYGIMTNGTYYVRDNLQMCSRECGHCTGETTTVCVKDVDWDMVPDREILLGDYNSDGFIIFATRWHSAEADHFGHNQHLVPPSRRKPIGDK